MCAWRVPLGAASAYAEGMASTPFTLAALATSAVPQLEVTGTRPHTSGSGGAFTSAVLATNRGEVIIRVPATPTAEVQQSAELLGLGALGEGVRAQLPFEIPTTLGITRAGDTRAVASTFLTGMPAMIEDFESSPELLRSLASALAAIHALPSSVVRQGGLPVREASEVRQNTARLIERASATGLLPPTLKARWATALQVDTLWSFEPTVIHGSLEAEQILISGNDVSGILGWGELSVGDPANDLSWLFEVSGDTAEAAIAHYSNSRDISGVPELISRSKLYRELEVARWLLHGVESHDENVIADATSMLDRLVDRISTLGTPAPERQVFNDAQVEQMLNRTPVIDEDRRSETAEFEALDEDRVFSPDSDFMESDEPETNAGDRADGPTNGVTDQRSQGEQDRPATP